MRKQKFRTPEEVAKEIRPKRVQISAIVNEEHVDYLRKRAKSVGLSLSDLVNEAITSYVEHIKDVEGQD